MGTRHIFRSTRHNEVLPDYQPDSPFRIKEGDNDLAQVKDGGGGQVCYTDEMNKNYIMGVLTGCPHLTGQNMGRGLAVINKNIRCNEQSGYF